MPQCLAADHIRNTLDRLEGPAIELIECFYDVMFEFAPDTKALFTNDMRAQSSKFLKLLAQAVDVADQLDDQADHLRQLGASHARYGVKSAHYDILPLALLYSLSIKVRDWTPADHAAWMHMLDRILAHMRAGAEEMENETRARA